MKTKSGKCNEFYRDVRWVENSNIKHIFDETSVSNPYKTFFINQLIRNKHFTEKMFHNRIFDKSIMSRNFRNFPENFFQKQNVLF